MFEKRSRLGALILMTVASINGIAPSIQSVPSILSPVAKKVSITKKSKRKLQPLKSGKTRVIYVPPQTERLAIEEVFLDFIQAIDPYLKEALSRAYNLYLASIGEKIRDLWPLSVTLSMDNNSYCSFTDDKEDIEKIYANDPDLEKYRMFGMTAREQYYLADFKNKNSLQIAYRGPMFPLSTQSYIVFSRAEKKEKIKEAIEGINKTLEMLFELFISSESVKNRRMQVDYLKKNLKDVEVKMSAGSASSVDRIEAEESLAEYSLKLEQDLVKISTLRKRCKNYGIDPEKAIEALNKASKKIHSCKIEKDVFIRKFQKSIRMDFLRGQYISAKIGHFSSSVSAFSPNLDLSASFGDKSREFNFGIKTEGIKFGQFMKTIGQRETSIYNHNNVLRTIYGEMIDMFNNYNSLLEKRSYCVKSVESASYVRKSLEAIFKDAASRDSSSRGKISESEVLKAKISEQESIIKLTSCKAEILKQAFQIILYLYNEKDVSNSFKRSQKKVQLLSIDELEQEIQIGSNKKESTSEVNPFSMLSKISKETQESKQPRRARAIRFKAQNRDSRKSVPAAMPKILTKVS